MSALPPDGAETPGEAPTDAEEVDAGKRKGKVKVRHTVAKVVTSTLVVIALVTGLSVVFLYRHYNSNLDAENLDSAIGAQGVSNTAKWPAPSGPINILVMGSDNRDAPGDHVDNLTGIGQRSDTTILLHLSADRSARLRREHPARLGHQPSRMPRQQRQADLRADHGRHVERRLQRRRTRLHDPPVHRADPRPGVPLDRRRLRRVQGDGRRARRGQRLPARTRSTTRSGTSPCRPAPTSSPARRPSTTSVSATTSATARTSAG